MKDVGDVLRACSPIYASSHPLGNECRRADTHAFSSQFAAGKLAAQFVSHVNVNIVLPKETV